MTANVVEEQLHILEIAISELEDLLLACIFLDQGAADQPARWQAATMTLHEAMRAKFRRVEAELRRVAESAP